MFGTILTIGAIGFGLKSLFGSGSDFPSAPTLASHDAFSADTSLFHSSTIDHSSDLFSQHIGPMVNIDGTPMIGDSNIDIHGHPYGVTDSSYDSFSSSSSMFSDNSFGGSDSFSSSSSFSNDW